MAYGVRGQAQRLGKPATAQALAPAAESGRALAIPRRKLAAPHCAYRIGQQPRAPEQSPAAAFIASAFNSEEVQAKLQRFNPARLPEDERLFVHGLGGITSFMAGRGIEDLGEGVGEYLQQAKKFHVARSGFKHDGMERYVGRKVKAKNRRYNTVKNEQPLEYQSIAAADTYQLAKDAMMETLNLEQAAAFLKMHPVTVQGKARSGEITVAKPGKCWAFIKDDLASYLRSLYSSK